MSNSLHHIFQPKYSTPYHIGLSFTRCLNFFQHTCYRMDQSSSKTLNRCQNSLLLHCCFEQTHSWHIRIYTRTCVKLVQRFLTKMGHIKFQLLYTDGWMSFPARFLTLWHIRFQDHHIIVRVLQFSSGPCVTSSSSFTTWMAGWVFQQDSWSLVISTVRVTTQLGELCSFPVDHVSHQVSTSLYKYGWMEFFLIRCRFHHKLVESVFHQNSLPWVTSVRNVNPRLLRSFFQEFTR